MVVLLIASWLLILALLLLNGWNVTVSREQMLREQARGQGNDTRLLKLREELRYVQEERNDYMQRLSATDKACTLVRAERDTLKLQLAEALKPRKRTRNQPVTSEAIE